MISTKLGFLVVSVDVLYRTYELQAANFFIESPSRTATIIEKNRFSWLLYLNGSIDGRDKNDYQNIN